jgi:hypothetical protein
MEDPHTGENKYCVLSYPFHGLAGQNFELADTAVEAAASTVNQHPELAVSLDFARSVKKDVQLIVQGPCVEEPTFYILAGFLRIVR